MAESGSEVKRSRMGNYVLRPGRAERVQHVVAVETVAIRQDAGNGDCGNPALTCLPTNTIIDSTGNSAVNVVNQVFAELHKAANALGSVATIPPGNGLKFPSASVGIPVPALFVATALKQPDISLLQDAIDGPDSHTSPPTPQTPMSDQIVAQESPLTIPSRPMTFFSKMPASFTDILIDQTKAIPTVPFLDACQEIPKILDLMCGRAFGPVKSDLNGNITKIRLHHTTSPETTATLQELVISERTSLVPPKPSPTEALLWLKRSLTFMDIFLVELLSSDKETLECAQLAYKTSLQPYHGLVVRTAFWAALFALPKRKDFIVALAERKEDAEDPVFVAALMEDAKKYAEALQRVTRILNDFYVQA